jgi:hypothetical protein
MIARFALRLVLAAWTLPVFCLPARAQDSELRASEVVMPASMMIPAPDNLKSLFPGGFTPGLGFGLSCDQGQPGGSMILHTLTGRGPVLPGPMIGDSARPTPGSTPVPAQSIPPSGSMPVPPAGPASAPPAGDKCALAPSSIFVLPGFNPSIVTMKLSGGKVEVIGELPLRGKDGQPLLGLPTAPGANGGLPEIPLGLPPASQAQTLSPEMPQGLSFTRLGFEENGIDPQGVAFDFKSGLFWLVDGYRPALVGISPGDGRVRRMYAPGAGLESYLATRRPGWGFMDVSISPGGKVYTIMRGVLAVDGKPAVFSRIIELDPDTERVRQLPYPIDDGTFADPAQVSTAEVAAYADKHLLVLEQGIDKEGHPRSLVYAADLTRTSNINHVHNEAGQPPEVVTDKIQLQKNIQLARKTLVLDLQQAGYREALAESVTLLSDGRTLAIMGGHGFGLQEKIADFATGPDGKPVLDPRRYLLAPDGTLSMDGQPTKTSFCIWPTRETPRLWLVTLPKKVFEY